MIVNIEFNKRKRKNSDTSQSSKILKPTDDEQLSFLSSMQKIAPDAAVLKSCFIMPESSNVSYIRSLPPALSSLEYQPHYKNLSPNDLKIECQKVESEKNQFPSFSPQNLCTQQCNNCLPYL